MTHKFDKNNPLIRTIKNLCRVCYTCVRECPAKAIKISNGQAEVINERCIGCGNCVTVCSQGAKTFYSSIGDVENLLKNNRLSIACIAPSFPAEFLEIDDYQIVVGMIKKLGFDYVMEVAFGADLVSLRYNEIFDNPNASPIITSDCPAIAYYIQQYNPDLVRYLAKIDSPAMATAKVAKQIFGNNANLVFIGPCTAKKAESELFDAVLTFSELRKMFIKYNISPNDVTPSDFDGPKAAYATIFPVNHGLLNTLGKKESLGPGSVLVAEGKQKFREAINEFEKGTIIQHLELLCCDGCINGAGISNQNSKIQKRYKVHQYHLQRMQNIDLDQWKKNIETFSKLDFSRNFKILDRRPTIPDEKDIEAVLTQMNKTSKRDLLNCGACGYESCREFAIAVCLGLAEFEMCLPYTIENLHKYNQKLQEARQALKQSEKLASMGQLAAGIAHELNNPLGVITLYSSIVLEETPKESQFYSDIKTIYDQAERCRNIVSGLLNFARKNRVNIAKVDLVSFINEAFKSVVIPNNINYQIVNKLNDTLINFDKDQMMQAITNLIKNSVDAMPDGGNITAELSDDDQFFYIKITDTGTGITPENLDKIFTPFFTTKPAGKGTGLGLPLVYGIIKMHRGQISVKSNADTRFGPTYTTFTISIPKNLKNE